MHPMIKRAAATQACVDRFAGQSYVSGKRDCARLAAHALHKMGRKAVLLNASKHTTEAGALRYLKRTGFASLADLVDALGLERIAPAQALPGDIVGLASGDAFGCSLTVAMGDGLVLGTLAGRPFEVLIPRDFVAAWRV